MRGPGSSAQRTGSSASRSRWTPDCDAYKDAAQEQTLRKYRLALDSFERLVVQRLLELSKLGMSGLGASPLCAVSFTDAVCCCRAGYKLREKIGKALRTRAEAIRKALDEYNKQAPRLDPPRPKLQWTQLVAMTSLGEFDLLRDARCDVRQFAWAHPSHREATRLHFNVKRAREETYRCNVEIRRLVTFLYDAHVDYCLAISANPVREPASRSVVVESLGTARPCQKSVQRISAFLFLFAFHRCGVSGLGSHYEWPGNEDTLLGVHLGLRRPRMYGCY